MAVGEVSEAWRVMYREYDAIRALGGDLRQAGRTVEADGLAAQAAQAMRQVRDRFPTVQHSKRIRETPKSGT
jgi:hypothetical protein